MRIVLAGHNVDVDVLRQMKKEIIEPAAHGWEESRLDAMSEAELRAQAAELQRRAADFLDRDNLTPEPISASYARISRDPRPIDELRAIARRRGGKGAQEQPEHHLRLRAQFRGRTRELQHRRHRREPLRGGGDTEVQAPGLHRKEPALHFARRRLRRP